MVYSADGDNLRDIAVKSDKEFKEDSHVAVLKRPADQSLHISCEFDVHIEDALG